MERGFSEGQIATVKGLQGLRHATLNKWDNSGNKLVALCGKSVSPNYRDRCLQNINCPKCKLLLKSEREEAPASVVPVDKSAS